MITTHEFSTHLYPVGQLILLVLNLGYYVPLESLEAPHSMSYDIGQVFLDLSVQISVRHIRSPARTPRL